MQPAPVKAPQLSKIQLFICRYGLSLWPISGLELMHHGWSRRHAWLPQRFWGACYDVFTDGHAGRSSLRRWWWLFF